MSNYFEPSRLTANQVTNIDSAATNEQRGTTQIPFVRPASVTSALFVIATNAAANTSSAYTQITAGEGLGWAFWGYLTLNLSNLNAYDIDWATGAAGAEVVIGTTRDITNTAGEIREKIFRFPLQVGAGVRLSARNRTENAGGMNQYVAIFGIPWLL